jgi:MFS transporter, OFA family, oxalate/formate antiporter
MLPGHFMRISHGLNRCVPARGSFLYSRRNVPRHQITATALSRASSRFMSPFAASSAPAASDRHPSFRGDRGLLAHPAPDRDLAVPSEESAASAKVFYGWAMAVLAMAVMIASAPGQTYGFMSFNSSLRQSLALSQTEFSGIYLLATLCAALPLSYLGRLTDRFGLRRSMLAAVAAMAAVCMIASTVEGAWMLFAACFGLRLVGAGLMSLLATNTLAAWFDRRLGLACGIMQFGGAASVALVPIGLMFLIDGVGWRSAYLVLGVGLMVGLWPLIAIAYRQHPSDVGQHVDGDAAPQADAD